MDFAVPVDLKVKLKESEKKYKYLDLTREMQKTMEHESEVDNDCNLLAPFSHQRSGKETRGIGNKWKSEDYPNNCIAEIGQNTE